MRAWRALDWHLPLALGVIGAALLAAGFFLGATGRIGHRLGPPVAQAAEVDSGRYQVVSLGDSITAGVGDGRGGYVARVAEGLRRRGRSVAVSNLAVSGDRTGDVQRRIEAEHTRREIARARLILLSVGGNDLSRGLREDDDAESTLATTGPRLRQIVARLRALNPTAAIRLVGLYNPFEILPQDQAQARTQLLDWNVAIERAVLDFPGVLAVPVADLFTDRPDRLAGDRYHPGPKGHEAIAERVLSTLREAESN